MKKAKREKIDQEKGILVYMTLANQFPDNREEIKYGNFNNLWGKMFREDTDTVDSKSIKRKKDILKKIEKDLKNLSLEEIQEYRNQFCIYKGATVPNELKSIAGWKNCSVVLADDKNKHLSGFSILNQNKKMLNSTLNFPAYGMDENDVKRSLKKMLSEKEIQENEINLMNILNDENADLKYKKKCIDNYQAPYATHKFEKYMNRYTLKGKEWALVLQAVSLCKRVGIVNMQNRKPILFCCCAVSRKKKHGKKKR